MKPKNQKALVIQEYGGKIIPRQVPIPQIKDGEVLIKVDASTINPSDRLLMDGACFERPLPSICGIQGTGRVIDGKGELAQLWIGVRVSFISPAYGSWVQYCVSTPFQIFQIDENVSMDSAACGIINPLTAIAFIERYRASKCRFGMINTAAASSLGKMLIRLCKKQNVPLLNIVRRDEQKQMLHEIGAQHVIVTKNEWKQQYKQFIQKYKFDCLFDAIGGGQITQSLIKSLLPNAKVYIYGALQGKSISIPSAVQLLRGLSIQGFLIFSWWGRCQQSFQQQIRQNLSTYLHNQLSTHIIKSVYFQQIDKVIDLSQQKSSQGKIILKMYKQK